MQGTLPDRAIELPEVDLSRVAARLLPVQYDKVVAIPSTADTGESEQHLFCRQMIEVIMESRHVVAHKQDVFHVRIFGQNGTDGQAASPRHDNDHEVITIFRIEPFHKIHAGDEAFTGETVDDLDPVLLE